MTFSHTNVTSGGSIGLLHTTDYGTGVIAGSVISSITVPAAGWYDVEVITWADVVGALSTDDYNIALYSDPVTAASMVLQRVLPFDPFVPAAGKPLAPSPLRTRVYAQSTLTIQGLATGTATCKYVVSLTAMPVTEWNAGI